MYYINITFNSYDLFNCTIGYIYVVTEPDYEIFDDECHKVIGRGVKETWCEDCGEVFESIDIQINKLEEHDYVDGVCIHCESACNHNSTYYEYS